MANKVIPPPYAITADDKRGLIVVTVAIILAFVWVCSLIRIWLRYQSRDWKTDDSLLAGATIVHTVQSGILFNLAASGLGAPQDGMSLSQLKQFGKEGFATQILYVCILFLSKCSVLFLYLRLSPDGKHRLASFTVLALSAAWAIIAIILIAVPCNPIQAYTLPASQCTNRWPKWQAIGSLDIVTEVLIFMIALLLVWTLQMRLKAKLIVTFAFSARLPVIAIAAVRLYYIHQRFSTDTHTYTYLIATQWQIGYAIMSCTITGIGPFLRPFDQDYTPSYKKYAYGDSSGRSRVSKARGAEVQPEPQRSSWQSEGYLMQPINTLPESTQASVASHPSNTIHSASRSTATTPEPQESSPPKAQTILTADANFRPVDAVVRNDAEVWVGERSCSFGTEDAMPHRASSGLVISKRTQFKVEIDRASRVI